MKDITTQCDATFSHNRHMDCENHFSVNGHNTHYTRIQSAIVISTKTLKTDKHTHAKVNCSLFRKFIGIIMIIIVKAPHFSLKRTWKKTLNIK